MPQVNECGVVQLEQLQQEHVQLQWLVRHKLDSAAPAPTRSEAGVQTGGSGEGEAAAEAAAQSRHKLKVAGIVGVAAHRLAQAARSRMAARGPPSVAALCCRPGWTLGGRSLLPPEVRIAALAHTNPRFALQLSPMFPVWSLLTSGSELRIAALAFCRLVPKP